MKIPENLLNLGFSRYEAKVYLALIGQDPLNGSQLSRISGVPRANIYNVLATLQEKEMVVQAGNGRYAPLPPDELVKRLEARHKADLEILEDTIASVRNKTTYEYVWTITGYQQTLAKAGEMISSAREELYIRFFPEEGRLLAGKLIQARRRGVEIKYISLGPSPVDFEKSVVHPEAEELGMVLGGRTIEMVADRQEVLSGFFRTGHEDEAKVVWSKNQWLAFSNRDSIRHDFFHAFLYKLFELKETLTETEEALYWFIQKDSWAAAEQISADRKADSERGR